MPTSPSGRVPLWVLDERRTAASGVPGHPSATAARPAVLPSPAGPPAIEALPPAALGHAGPRPALERAAPADVGPDVGRSAPVDGTAPPAAPAAPSSTSRTRRRSREGVGPASFALGVVCALAATTFGPGLIDDARRALAPVVASAPWLDAVAGRVVPLPVSPPPGAEEMPTRLSAAPAVDHVSPSYAYLQTQPDGRTPVAWSPCRPVHYVVRPDGEPPGGGAVLDEAFSRLAAATGLVFVADGATTEGPSADRPAYQPDRYGDRWAPVLVTWSDPAEDARLADGVAGVAGPIALGAVGRPSVVVSGTVSLDAEQLGPLLDDPDGRAQARAVVVHELAHVVGLGHVDDPQQLMAPRTDPAVTDLQPGDLTGLALLGSGPCAPWL